MKLSSIKPNPNNPRVIKDDSFNKLCKSIQDFPKMMSLRPIVVDNNMMILGGNMRFKALQHLGFKEIPDEWVKRAEDLTEDEARRFIIVDNVSGGEWDVEDLSNNWDRTDLEEWGLELDWPVDKTEAVDDDYEIPDMIETDIVLGDVFEIGRHRLMCGDSTSSDDVEKLMNGEKADMVFTSPPYWVGFEYENEKDKKSILQHIHDVSVNLAMYTKGKIVINTGNIASITTAEKITGKRQPALLVDWWIEALNKNNFLLRHIRIWAKNGGVMPSRANDKIDMHWEYMALFTDEDNNAGMIATFKQQTDKEGIEKNTPAWAVNGVWNDIRGNARSNKHVAAFPVQLVDRYAKMYTHQGNVFFEPYCGSGTTMVAAHQLKRKCYGMELDPKYCQVIIDRMQKLAPEIEIKKNGQKIQRLDKVNAGV